MCVQPGKLMMHLISNRVYMPLQPYTIAAKITGLISLKAAELSSHIDGNAGSTTIRSSSDESDSISTRVALLCSHLLPLELALENADIRQISAISGTAPHPPHMP